MNPLREKERITIRRAVAADAQSIGRVFDAVVCQEGEYFGKLGSKPMVSREEWDKVVAEQAPPNVLLVAVNELDDLVGYTAVHSQEGEVCMLFVHPRYAHRGVGRALLAAGHEVLRAAGCREAFLYVHEKNKRALAVYEAAGYRRDGTVRESDLRGVHVREPRLVKAL